MFFVTFHETTKNVHAYDDDGNLLEKHVLSQSGDELRGTCLQGGRLYVAQGGKGASKISVYEGSGTSYTYKGDLVTKGGAIDHPFSFTPVVADGKTPFYISNQNTNVVAAYLSSDGLTATPAPVASYLTGLYPQGKFLDGTLVASSVAVPDESGAGLTTVTQQQGGLDATVVSQGGKEKVQNSVRDVALFTADGSNPPMLFVADEPAGLVRVYETDTGKFLTSSNQLPSPVHLLIQGGTIYAGAGDQVYLGLVPDPFNPGTPQFLLNPIALQPPVTPKGAKKPESISGFAFDAEGNFHVAVRTANKVMKYDSNFANGVEWNCGAMKDQPEFLLYVPDAS